MAMSNDTPFSLFSVVGIEIEYMIVLKDSLSINPQSDQLLKTLNTRIHHCTDIENEIVINEIAASNELVLHIIELKNHHPQAMDAHFVSQFHTAVTHLNDILGESGCQLLPTAAHPWMDPHTETKRWPHDSQEIYSQFDRIFDCRGHGWSNLQSMHINLPFSGDVEFFKLHSAIRLLLPLLPALAASSPILDGKPTGHLDTRLCYYAKNQQKIPSISGSVIPEWITSKDQYQNQILQPMYQDIHLFDTQGLLQEEWLNSRGAIPKFNYNAIEIRIVDTQECVQSDIAIAKAVFYILKYWINDSDYFLNNPASTEQLKTVFNQTMTHGLKTRIDEPELLKQWQVNKKATTVHAVWEALLEKIESALDPQSIAHLSHILSHGNLSERILKACNHNYTHNQLVHVYQQLGSCLKENTLF